MDFYIGIIGLIFGIFAIFLHFQSRLSKKERIVEMIKHEIIDKNKTVAKLLNETKLLSKKIAFKFRPLNNYDNQLEIFRKNLL